MPDIYLSGLGFACGREKSLEELAADGNISRMQDFFRTEGYRQAYIVEEDRLDFINRALDIPEEAETLIYNRTFLELPSATPSPADEDPEKYLLYGGEQLLQAQGRTEMTYLGLGQQGCTGFLSAVQTGVMRVSCGLNCCVYCVSDDILPPGIFHDVPLAKMLLSDTLSYGTVSTRPGGWKILNGREKSVLGKNFFGIVADTKVLIESLCQGFLAPKAVENIILPNHWRAAWASFLDRYQLPGCRDSTIDLLAHGLSADGISNLKFCENQGRISPGGVQLIVACGYGGHLRGLLLQAC